MTTKDEFSWANSAWKTLTCLNVTIFTLYVWPWTTWYVWSSLGLLWWLSTIWFFVSWRVYLSEEDWKRQEVDRFDQLLHSGDPSVNGVAPRLYHGDDEDHA